LAELFRDRGRAESFGSIAEQYDRYRPSAPDALLDEFAALRPSRVLDVGCGTGKVARGLMERGLTVLGIELDERMAAVARAHGVEVEVEGFEDWDDGGRTFDLITCGDAWHWIDPVRGWRKIGQVLRPGGTVARFWNHLDVDEPLHSAIRSSSV
jgi:SAM-dependent methyltransferase